MKHTVETTREILEETFSQLVFEEEFHTYTIGDRTLPSVSKKLTRFYDAFDSDKVAFYYTKKWNKNNPNEQKTKEQVLQEWKDKSTIALDKGNEVHDYAEYYPKFPEPAYLEQRGILEFFNNLPDHYEVVYVELRMHNDRFAGTADLILLNTKTNKLVIVDWKTNKDLFKNFKRKKLLYPFEGLLDAPINRYKIQLNHYKMLIEDMTVFEVEDMWVAWLTQKEDPTRKAKYIGENYILYKVYNWSKKLKRYYEQLEIHI